jgi:hypothetical protein
MKLILGFLVIALLHSSLAQDSWREDERDSLLVVERLDTLRAAYGTNKRFISAVEVPALAALSYYPELKSTRIEFKLAKINTTLNARPTIGSLLFRSRGNRKYVIRLNEQQVDSIIRFQDVPFAGKVGVLGHEFGHLVDYSDRSFFGILGRLLAYTSKKRKAAFEKEIDLLTIQRGLGKELYTWSYYVLYQSNAQATYKAFKAQIYLTPEEILEIINDPETP